ncbi:MAG: flagellar biosynthesis protein FlhA [Burkholderiaceae bacterium]
MAANQAIQLQRLAGATRLQVGGLTVQLPAVNTVTVPVIIVAMLSMMIMPLPALMLDLLFSFNIALALTVLLVAAYTTRPLDFSVFPAVLLITTLLRLSLNVASTRAVLVDGHSGTDVAGQVIESFAEFVVGGNFAVGIIVFAILTVINFIVVTKGAGRIAEVSARFALDAMPGKQMAIDADLNAGVIDQEEARQRRREVGQEADFFGAMDGASKFVRGDAIAGILILAINIVGGLVLGTVQHDMSLSQAADNYVLLAIGDALVAQIPSLIISIAAALVVSRVGSDDDVGGQMFKQLFNVPRAMGLTAVVIAILGSVPGMPHLAFLSLAAVCGYFAWWLSNRPEPVAQEPEAPTESSADKDASWDDVTPVDMLGMELGYKLISLVDKDNGAELLSRVKGVRKKFAQEVGFLPPSVHIRDNLELRPSAYRITLKGAVVGEADTYPGMWMAINPGRANLSLPGPQTVDPAFGLPAVWIEESQREAAQAAGYTVVDAATVMATHLHHLMQSRASRLLGRTEVQQLLDHAEQFASKLVEEVVPKVVSVARLQRILQNLLTEGVHVRDMRTVLEALAEFGPLTEETDDLTNAVRRALAPALVQQIYGPSKDLDVIAMDPELEQLMIQALNGGDNSAIDPGVADFFAQSAATAANEQEEAGIAACLLVPDAIRTEIAKMVRKTASRLRVLSHSEIPETHSIRIGRIIGASQ